jgi:hypothetical protein
MKQVGKIEITFIIKSVMFASALFSAVLLIQHRKECNA